LHLRYKKITIQILLKSLNSIYKEINNLSHCQKYVLTETGITKFTLGLFYRIIEKKKK